MTNKILKHNIGGEYFFILIMSLDNIKSSMILSNKQSEKIFIKM